MKWIAYDHGSPTLYLPPGPDRPEGILFKRGEPQQVPDEVAGRGPFWRPAEPGEDVTGCETRVAKGVLEVADLGTGLLAQVDLFREAVPPTNGKGD